MKKKILIDMDGVMADVYPLFVEYEEYYSKKKINHQTLINKSESEAFPHIRTFIFEEGFFYSPKPMKDAVRVVGLLNQHYEIIVVSAATEFPLSLTEKMFWLNKYFPFLNWKQIIFCGDKSYIKGDIMIDDHFKNLDFFEGQGILFTQPHNSLKNTGKNTRVNNWAEIEKLLLISL